MKEKLRNENGSILATTLIIMAILALLGTTLLNFSSIEALQSKHYEKTLQSKYMARSGADIMAEYIISNKDDFENLYDNDKSTYLPHKIELDGGETSVDVEEILDDEGEREGFNIISRGKYDNSKKTIELTLRKIKLGNDILFYKDLEIVDLPGTRYNRIDNTVINNIINKNNIKKENDIVVGTKKTETLDLTENKEYENIEIKNEANLIIKTGGEDRILLVNNLDAKGFIVLSQDISDQGGRLVLIVKKSAVFKSPYVDKVNHLFIMGADDSEIEISPMSGKDFALHVFSPFGATKIDPDATIDGALIVSKNSELKIAKINHRLANDIKIKGYDFFNIKFNIKEMYVKENYNSSFK